MFQLLCAADKVTKTAYTYPASPFAMYMKTRLQIAISGGDCRLYGKDRHITYNSGW